MWGLVGVASDQDPGHRPVTGQPTTGLRIQGAAGGVTTQAAGAGVAGKAVQIHQHRQLGADPAGLGQPTTLQGPAGQFGQGISPALTATAGILGAGRAGQGLQGGQQGLAGLGLQQPIDGHHALQGGGQPQSSPLVAVFGMAGGALGVGDQLEVADDPPEPARIQPAGRLDQDRFGLDRDLVGELVSAGGQDAGMGGGELAVGQGLAGGRQGTAEEGSGGADGAAGRPGAHAQPGPQPAGGRAGLYALFGAGNATGVDDRKFAEPVAFQAVQQPPQAKDPFGPGGVAQTGQVLGGQPLECRRQRRQPLRRPGRMCVRVHGGNLSSPRPKASTKAEIVDNVVGGWWFGHHAGSWGVPEVPCQVGWMGPKAQPTVPATCRDPSPRLPGTPARRNR